MSALTLVNAGVLSVNCCIPLKINSSDRHLIMLLSVLLSLLSSATKLPLSSQSLQVKLHLFIHHHLTPSVTIQLCNSSSQSLHLKSSKFKILSSIPSKTSVPDFVPTSVRKLCPSLFSYLIAHLANLSFSKGVFPSKFQHPSVSPILKKPNLDPSEPANYRKIYNLNNIF